MSVKFSKFSCSVTGLCTNQLISLLVKSLDLVIGLEITLIEFLFGIDKFLRFPSLRKDFNGFRHLNCVPVCFIYIEMQMKFLVIIPKENNCFDCLELCLLKIYFSWKCVLSELILPQAKYFKFNFD